MSMITTYRLRDESSDALWRTLAAVSEGKSRAYAFVEADGTRLFDEARVKLPWPETVPGTPENQVDAEAGESVPVTPLIATGFMLVEVSLVDEGDADLAAASIDVQAASG